MVIAPLYRIRSVKKSGIFDKNQLTCPHSYGIVIITCGNGAFFLRVFRFSRGESRRFGRREAIVQAVPGYMNKEVPLGMRVKITLRCNECKQRNYNTVKNKKNDPDRLEMNKYCPFCRKHTVHTETK